MILGDAMGNLSRWRLPFVKIEFEIVHLVSTKIHAANGMWRFEPILESRTPLDDNFPTLAIANGQQNQCPRRTNGY